MEAHNRHFLGRGHVEEFVPRRLSYRWVDIERDVPIWIAQEQFGNVCDVLTT